MKVLSIVFASLTCICSFSGFAFNHHFYYDQNVTSDSIKESSLEMLKRKYLWISEGATFELSSSGSWDRYGKSEMLLDGSSYLNSEYDYAFHTQSSSFGQQADSTPYVIIDLKQVARIDAVLIKNRNRNEAAQKRADGLTAWYSEDSKNWVRVDKVDAIGSEWFFECGKLGRYIKLGFEEKRLDPLHLRAVWVFGSFVTAPFEGKWITTNAKKIKSINVTSSLIGRSSFSQIGRNGSDYLFLDKHRKEVAKLKLVSEDYAVIVKNGKTGLVKKSKNIPDLLVMNSPPDNLLGNWLNTTNGPYWQLGIMPKVFIYGNKIWDYERITFDGNFYDVELSLDGERKKIRLVQDKPKYLSIISSDSQEETILTNDPQLATRIPENKSEKVFVTPQVVVQGYIEGLEFSNDKYKKPNASVEFIVNNLIYGDQLTFSSTFHESGKFVSSFDMPNAQDIYFRNGRGLSTIFVSPGDTLTLYMKNNMYQGVLFMGDHADVSNDIHYQNKGINNALPKWEERKDSIGILEPEQYKSYRGKSKRAQEGYLAGLLENTQELSELFKEWAAMKISYDYYEDLMRYRWLSAHYSKNKNKRFDTHATYFDFLEEIDFDDPRATIATSFGSLVGELDRHLSSKNSRKMTVKSFEIIEEFVAHSKIDLTENERLVIEKMKSGNDQMDSTTAVTLNAIYKKFGDEIQEETKKRFSQMRAKAQMQILDSISSDVLKELIVTKTIYRSIDGKDLDEAKSIFQMNSSRLKTLIYKELLEQELVRLEKLIASELPDYVHINSNPESEGEELLKEIIEKHQSKVLYLDFWATWCGPCISSFKQSKSIKERFEDSDVVFVYLCGSNSNSEAYENILKAHDVKGEHYYLTESQWKSLWDKFGVSGIPHFALINKDGQVENSNAPRPYGTEIIEAIEKLL